MAHQNTPNMGCPTTPNRGYHGSNGSEKLPGMNTPCITIGTSAIRATPEGLYSLNDLHTAAGGESKHQPSNFLRLETTVALMEEITNSSDLRSLQTITGRNGGTFACKELVIAYAAWISAAFHLKVIRVFLQQQEQQQGPQLLSRKRWLVTFRDGREVIQEVDPNAALLNFEDLPKIIKDPGTRLPPALLASICQASAESLSKKAAATERARTAVLAVSHRSA